MFPLSGQNAVHLLCAVKIHAEFTEVDQLDLALNKAETVAVLHAGFMVEKPVLYVAHDLKNGYAAGSTCEELTGSFLAEF